MGNGLSGARDDFGGLGKTSKQTVEILSFRVLDLEGLVSCGDMSETSARLVIAGREFRSRLLLGTGKFSSGAVMGEALEASGCEIVTVALRRADLSGKSDPFANILEFIDPKKYLILPNTSGAMTAEEAIRLAHRSG